MTKPIIGSKKKKNKRNKIIFLLLLLISAGGLGYYYWFAPEEVAAITYQTGKVKQGDLLVSIDNSGVIQYVDEREITSSVNGTISQIFVEEKTAVNPGDPILTLDDQELQLQIEQAYSDLKIAQLKLADLLQTTIDKIDQVSIDQLGRMTAPVDGVVHFSLEEGMSVSANHVVMTIKDNQQIRFVVGLPSNEVKQVKVGQEAAIRVDDFSGSVAGTVKKVSDTAYSNGFTMIYDVEIVVNNPGMLASGMAGTAEIYADSGKIIRDGQFKEAEERNIYARINGTLKNIYVDDGQYVKKGTVLAQLDNPSLLNQIESQKTVIHNIQLKIKQLEQHVVNYTVMSPQAGTISEIYVKTAQPITSNTKLAKIVSNDLAVKLEIDELDIGKVALGQEATLFIPAIGNEEIPGTVTSISDSGMVKDGITTYEVSVHFPANEKVKAGMTADVSILLEKAEDVLMVPTTSVIDVKGGKAVRVLVDGEITVKKVETGISNDTMTEIISGIAPTDEIITSLTIPNGSSDAASNSSSFVPSNVSIPGVSGPGGGGGGK